MILLFLKFVYLLLFLTTNAKSDNLPNCSCGKLGTPDKSYIETIKYSASTRIVNGSKTYPHEFPWMTAIIREDDKVFCGASLISPRFILTAGHCMFAYQYNSKGFKAVLGLHRLSNITEGISVKAKKVYIHSNFSVNTMKNDIALIELEQPVTFTETISPVCLMKEEKDLAHEVVTVSG